MAWGDWTPISTTTTMRQQQAAAPAAGGANMDFMKDYLKQLQAAQDKANAANEARYQQTLGLYDTLGKSGAEQIQGQTAQQQAGMTQQLAGRGLGNTTIGPSMQTGIASQGQSNLLALQEQLAREKAGVMEQKTDQGPNLSLFTSLLQGIGMGQQQQQQPRSFTQLFPSPGGGNTSGGGFGGGSGATGGGGPGQVFRNAGVQPIGGGYSPWSSGSIPQTNFPQNQSDPYAYLSNGGMQMTPSY